MEKRAAGVPEALARLDNRVVRPRDLADRYTNPATEFGRMAGTGVLAKVGRGYCAVVPEDQRGRRWTPPIEEIALGVAAVDYGASAVVRFCVGNPKDSFLTAVRAHDESPHRRSALVVGDLDARVGPRGGGREDLV